MKDVHSISHSRTHVLHIIYHMAYILTPYRECISICHRDAASPVTMPCQHISYLLYLFDSIWYIGLIGTDDVECGISDDSRSIWRRFYVMRRRPPNLLYSPLCLVVWTFFSNFLYRYIPIRVIVWLSIRIIFFSFFSVRPNQAEESM